MLEKLKAFGDSVMAVISSIAEHVDKSPTIMVIPILIFSGIGMLCMLSLPDSVEEGGWIRKVFILSVLGMSLSAILMIVAMFTGE